MPTYEYKCKECGHQFELWQEVGADAPACPECGAEVQKVFHPVRTIFKGSGFYVTDSRPAVSKSTDSETKETKSESTEKPATETKSSESTKTSGAATKESSGKDS